MNGLTPKAPCPLDETKPGFKEKEIHSPGGKGEWQRLQVRQKHWGNSHMTANTTLLVVQI